LRSGRGFFAEGQKGPPLSPRRWRVIYCDLAEMFHHQGGCLAELDWADLVQFYGEAVQRNEARNQGAGS
ncbi:hypothetical protein, partial [Vibrio parahaemolyticus]|uniref:hypothetical protein n=1 Tax=Vibrio parahaemolyticus TaxID=670 RepID=UPI001A8D2536